MASKAIKIHGARVGSRWVLLVRCLDCPSKSNHAYTVTGADGNVHHRSLPDAIATAERHIASDWRRWTGRF